MISRTMNLTDIILTVPALYKTKEDIAHPPFIVTALIGTGLFCVLLLTLFIYRTSRRLNHQTDLSKADIKPDEVLNRLEPEEINRLLQHIETYSPDQNCRVRPKGARHMTGTAGIIFLLYQKTAAATTVSPAINSSFNPGVIITIILIMIPVLVLFGIACVRIKRIFDVAKVQRGRKAEAYLTEAFSQEPEYSKLVNRKLALDYQLSGNELAGNKEAEDERAVLQHIEGTHGSRPFAIKKRSLPKHDIDPRLTKLILLFIICATFWLVLGTSIGEYLGIKFVAPDSDHIPWLSFGRLRPVHTNMVFWGWSSMAMVGLGYYVVSRVSNTALTDYRTAYVSLLSLNAAILLGSWSLMAGINNGGGEYREYVWPVMSLFAAGIITSLYNYLKIIASRRIPEIYISNWYVIAAMMFLCVIVLVGYLPWWQNSLGETIVQGYYMHQAVGMWFMMFNLGLIYYFLPQLLNSPIYSYSLGIIAFWSQILFYTVIGTHHFIFSAIPWWLQTVAIIGSVGMLIPVLSGTTNFLMTIKGNYSSIFRSYTLPFYLVGIVFYFTGSFQGTAEAFRESNQLWHFTDFTVAHSHLTMYGIIAFILWGSIYTLIPRLTGNEPKQVLVGAHFWMAVTGLLVYTIPLMVGGTLRGKSWIAGEPFIQSVILMKPFWLWRAIGGSLMWGAHLVFSANLFVMVRKQNSGVQKNEFFNRLSDITEKASIQGYGDL